MYERIFYLLLVETRDVFYVQMTFEEENAEHLQISLILHFSTSPILQLRLLKLCKALAHPYFYQIDISFHLIPSQSQEWSHPNSPRLQKLCTLLRGGGGREYSSSVPLFSTQGLWHKQVSPELWCSRWVVWLWSYVIDSELLPKPTSISITHLLKLVNNPGTEAAKWKAAFTTRSRRCNKAMILTFWLGRGGWEDALPLTWEY